MRRSLLSCAAADPATPNATSRPAMNAKRVRFMETSRVRAAGPPRHAAGATQSLPHAADACAAVGYQRQRTKYHVAAGSASAAAYSERASAREKNVASLRETMRAPSHSDQITPAASNAARSAPT